MSLIPERHVCYACDGYLSGHGPEGARCTCPPPLVPSPTENELRALAREMRMLAEIQRRFKEKGTWL